MAFVPLFPDAGVRMRITSAMDREAGVEFHCPCHGGTKFAVTTSASIPYASCPVCGSVCEPYVRPFLLVANRRP